MHTERIDGEPDQCIDKMGQTDMKIDERIIERQTEIDRRTHTNREREREAFQPVDNKSEGGGRGGASPCHERRPPNPSTLASA